MLSVSSVAYKNLQNKMDLVKDTKMLLSVSATSSDFNLVEDKLSIVSYNKWAKKPEDIEILDLAQSQ